MFGHRFFTLLVGISNIFILYFIQH